MADPAGPISGVGFSVDGLAEGLGELPAALDAVAALGVASAEIFLPALGVVLGGRVHARRLAELRRICAGRPFALTLHGPLSADLGDRDNLDLQRAVCRAGLEVAGEIGARLYVQHQTIAPSVEPQVVAARLACERESLHALAPEAAQAGAVLAVETMYCHPGEWTALPHELAAQVAAVDHPAVGAVFDFSHGALNAAARGADFLASAAALAPHARHLHIHDSFARPPAFRPWSRGDAMSFGFGDLHLPPGDGALDWAALAALPFDGPMIANLEIDRRWRPEWPRCVAFVRDWIAAADAAARAAARPVQLRAAIR
jgi:sugar phosphate isomerase/epimerase